MIGPAKILFFSVIWLALALVIGNMNGMLVFSDSTPWLKDPMSFLYQHLRYSVIPFGYLLLQYTYLIYRISQLIRQENTKLAQLTYYDRLLNATLGAFFGVGVIWTAVGMESALMQALGTIGQGSNMAPSLSAWQMLERLVNGGLLLALSTTVFGGVCGYILRILKIVLLGNEWDRFILQEVESGKTVTAQ